MDSGNLLGCLLALKAGLLEKLDEPVPAPAAIDGLADTASLVAEDWGETCQEVLAHFENPPSDLSAVEGVAPDAQADGRGAGGGSSADRAPTAEPALG